MEKLRTAMQQFEERMLTSLCGREFSKMQRSYNETCIGENQSSTFRADVNIFYRNGERLAPVMSNDCGFIAVDESDLVYASTFVLGTNIDSQRVCNAVLAAERSTVTGAKFR